MGSRFNSLLLLAGGLAVAGCNAHGQKQNVGTLAGGAAGALIGSQFGGGGGQIAATAIGAVAGAMIGSNIGARLDEADLARAEQARYQALEHTPSGQSTVWRNPDSGHQGSFKPVKTFKARNGQYCREYQQEIMIGGEVNQGYGRACRQPDGSWKISG